MSQVVTILATWGVYTLLGCGIVIVYRTSRVLNIAQGEIAILLGYIVAAAVSGGMPLGLAVPVGLVAAVGIGLAIFFLFLRRVMGEPPHVGLMVTVGLAVLLHGVMVIVFGGGMVTIKTGISGTVAFAGSTLSLPDLVAAAGAWLGVAAIFLIYRLTNLGLQMRAVAERVTLSAQRGVDVNRIVAVAWVIAVVAAALAGTLHGERAVISLAAAVIGINALVACLIGGMDSLKGLVIGAFLVASAEDFASRFIEPRYALLAPVTLLLLILVFRPWGLFGTAEEIRRV